MEQSQSWSSYDATSFACRITRCIWNHGFRDGCNGKLSHDFRIGMTISEIINWRIFNYNVAIRSYREVFRLFTSCLSISCRYMSHQSLGV